MTPTEEATRILKLHGGNLAAAMDLLERQLNVLYTRAQVLLSLAGIVITVTGFSGRLIAATDRVAQICIIAALATVLASAIYVFRSVMGVKWVSTDLSDDPMATLEQILARRNRRTLAYGRSGRVLLVGLGIYGIAIALMLLNPEPMTVPAR